MFKHPELFLSVAPGGSGYEPEKRIQENAGHESETLCFKPLGYNTWDLAQKFAMRTDAPELSIRLWDGTQCFNYAYNLKYSAYLSELGIRHKFLSIDGVGHTAIGSYDKHGNDIMLHHQQTFAAHRRKSSRRKRVGLPKCIFGCDDFEKFHGGFGIAIN